MKLLKDQLTAQGVHSLLVQFTDIHGTARGKLVPLAHLDDVLAIGAGFSGPSIWGTGLARTGSRSEYYARGIASTAVALPFMPGVARIVGEGFVAGEPFDACPRQVLARQAARLAERHWTLQVGIEPEFFLLKRCCFNCRTRWSAAGSTSCRSITKTRTASTRSTSAMPTCWPAPTA
jgi:glutamine synthetase